MYNKLLANAIVSYRFGKTQPITMSPGTTGQLYIEISQDLIQKRLLTAARIDELRTAADYNTALARLDQITGTVRYGDVSTRFKPTQR